ncbi:MAG: RodZ domain-containing protein [Alphaproteobacteria bacterium]
MTQPTPQEENIYQTDMPIGEILRRARMHYNQSLSDVENNIRIRASQIDAIEKGDFEKIPGRVYAIGFVRSYSEYLGLDGEKMVKLFKMQYGGSRVIRPELNFPVAVDDIRIAPPWLIGACLAGVVLILISWWALRGDDRTEIEVIPPVTEATQPPEETSAGEPVSQQFYGPTMPSGEEVAVAPEADAAPTAEAEKKTTILNIVQNSWVEIKDRSGKTLVSRVLQAGDRYYVPDSPNLLMSLGNSRGVEIIIDGEKLQPLGGVGEVQRNIPLDAASLKKNFGKAQ